MKGMLLVLALLVTRELEACPLFYEIFGMVDSGSKLLLNLSLDVIHATQKEKEGLGKIQDCYNELGLTSKILDLVLMGSITFSKECISQSLDMVENDLKKTLNFGGR